MKNYTITLLSLMIVMLSCTSVDQLSFLQTRIITATSSDGTSPLIIGLNTFAVTFTNSYTSTPTIGVVLCAFSSANSAHYAIQVTTQSLTTSGFNLKIALNQNLWTSLSYNVIATTADSIALGSLSITSNLGSSPTTSSQSISPNIVNSVQDKVKFDVFIMGFDLQPTSSSSKFLLNVAINYGDADTTNSLYSDYNDYVYQMSSGSFPSNTIAITATTLSLKLNWIGTLTSVQITYISHPVQSPLASNQLTTGFNTVAVTSTSSLTNIILFNPTKNKNNLGSLNTADFYGFTGIGLTPAAEVNTIDAGITLQYSYYVTLTTGSTIDFLKTSYYFYEPSANKIVDYLFNQNIPITWPSGLGTPTTATSTVDSYYTVDLEAGNSFPFTSSSFNQLNGVSYKLIIQAIDVQGCWSDQSKVLYSLDLKLNNDINANNKLTLSNTETAIVNPACTSGTSTQYQTPVEDMFLYKQFTSVAASTLSSTVTIDSNDNAGKIYLKNIKLFSVSQNQLIDPNIQETTVNAFNSFYTVTGTVIFYSQISTSIASNALEMSVQSTAPVTISTTTLSFESQMIYTLQFYILDSAGSIDASFSSPVLEVSLATNVVFTYTADATHLFYSSSFSEIASLTTPIDSNYKLITTTITPTQNSILSIKISDQSATDHKYWIRGITLKRIEYYNPVSRSNGDDCPANTILTKDTQPFACQSCDKRGQILSGTTCICADGKYKELVSGLCSVCGYRCLTCQTSATHCLTCAVGRTYNSGTNTCPCSDGKYDDGSNSVCASCDYTCLTCQTSATHCLSCPVGRTYNSGTNTCLCPNRKYDDGSNSVCASCNYKCFTCSTSATHCLSCPVGRTYNSGTNTCPCPAGKYDDGSNQVCETCDYNCLTCSTSATNCLSCAVGRTYNSGTNTCPCPDGKYDDGSNSVCASCNYKCLTCYSAIHCLTCAVGRTYNSGTNTCPCADGKYDDGSNSVCATCDYKCLTCSTSAIHCLTCAVGRTYNSGTNTCPCSDGKYDDGSNSVCASCDYTCLTCQTSATHCLSCPVGRTYNSGTNTCLCPNRKYDDGSNSVCASCNYKCFTCSTSATHCLSCPVGRTYNSGTNTCPCPAGKYDDGSNQVCETCDYNCLTCSTSATNCLSCAVGRTYNSGTNTCPCPDGKYDDGSNSVCASCNYKCLTCYSAIHCLTCAVGRTYNSGTNTCPCADGKYDDGSNSVCATCDYKCLTCSTSAIHCLTCAVGRTYNSGTNTCPCSDGKYDDGSNSVCASCDYTCLTCQTSATPCLSCAVGRTYDSGTNTCPCPDGKYDDGSNSVCASCDYTCLTCQTSATHCLSCPVGRTYDSGTNTCPCPDGKYDDGSNSVCASCNYNCLTCSTSATHCLSCAVGRTYDSGTNTCPCPDGKYDDGSNSVCATCNYNCLTCSTSAIHCLTCAVGRTYDSGTNTCLCPDGKYDDGSNSVCASCDYTCLTCSTSDTHCLSCAVGRTYDSTANTCPCSIGKYVDGLVCSTCSSICHTCSQNPNNCISCFSDSILSNSTCVCPSGYTMSSIGICINNSPQSYNPPQDQTSFSVSITLYTTDNSSLYNTCISDCSIATLSYTQSRRMLSTVYLTLTISKVIILSNNVVEYVILNPSVDVNNAIVIITINNPIITQRSIQYSIPHLYTSNTFTSLTGTSSSKVISQILLSILLFIMLVLYVLGYKHNHTINFIQKVSFLRFNILVIPSTFSFLYSLRYSYYAYGSNVLQSRLSSDYLQNSVGNFYLMDKDANILRNIGIPILISLAVLVLRLVGLGLFRQHSDNNDEDKLTFRKIYYRTIQYFERTIMFPIMFFSIAEIASYLYGISVKADSATYNASLAFSVLYLIYFGLLGVGTIFFSPKISKYAKMQLLGEYLFNLFDSIIIILTYFTNLVFTLIIIIVIKCAYEIFLKYKYQKLSKIDILKLFVMGLEIAIIGILGGHINSAITSLQALIIIIVIFDLIYASAKIFLRRQYKQNNSVDQQTSSQVMKATIKVYAVNESLDIVNLKN